MKKIAITLTMLFALILASCSEDINEVNESAQDLKQSIQTEINTNIGTYKGVFTTLNSEYRGTVEIELADKEANSLTKSFHRATIVLQNGDIVFATSYDRVIKGQLVNNINFNSDEISFTFSVNANGSQPLISNVVYNNAASDIIVAKHTTRAPVTALPGDYKCLTCNPTTQTFSLVISNDGTGNQTYLTQVIFNSTTYTGVGYQNNCVADVSETNLTFCNAYSGVDGGTDVGFLIEGNASKPVTWNAELSYNNGSTGPDDCTSIVGTWFYKKGQTGEKSGVFYTDTVVIPDNCLTILADERFDGPMVSYTTSIPEFTDGFNDYFIRTNGDDINSIVVINGVTGDYYFAAQDIDNANDDNDVVLPVNIAFENIDITGFNTIYFSAEFAEDKANDYPTKDWDIADYVHVDYSFDGGTTWTTFFAIENDGSTFNSAPFVDTNLDGTGDGQEITDTMENFRSSFATNGNSTVSIRIEMSLNSGDEDIAIDNVLVRGK